MKKSGTILVALLLLTLDQVISTDLDRFCPYELKRPQKCEAPFVSCQYDVMYQLGKYSMATDCSCNDDGLKNEHLCKCSVTCGSIQNPPGQINYCPYSLNLPGTCGPSGSSDCQSLFFERLGSGSMAMSKDFVCEDLPGPNKEHRCSCTIDCENIPPPNPPPSP